MKQLAVILFGFVAAISCGFYATINKEFVVEPTIARHVETQTKQTNVIIDNQNLVCNYNQTANKITLDHCKMANNNH